MSDDNWPKGLCNHGGHDLKECPQIAAPALLDQAKALVAKAKHDIETWRDYWREHEVTYSGQMIEDLINRLTPVYARAFAADKIEDERDKARDDCDDLRERAERLQQELDDERRKSPDVLRLAALAKADEALMAKIAERRDCDAATARAGRAEAELRECRSSLLGAIADANVAEAKLADVARRAREDCAKLVDRWVAGYQRTRNNAALGAARDIASAIRAREGEGHG